MQCASIRDGTECDTRHDIMARRAAMAKRRKKAMKVAKKKKGRKKRL